MQHTTIRTQAQHVNRYTMGISGNELCKNVLNPGYNIKYKLYYCILLTNTTLEFQHTASDCKQDIC